MEKNVDVCLTKQNRTTATEHNYVSSEWKKVAKEVGCNGENFIYTFDRRSCAHCVCYGTDAAINFAATENEAPNLHELCLELEGIGAFGTA